MKPAESISHGLRRLSKKELASALDSIRRGSPTDERAVHEARRSIKKLRALLRIVEKDDGRTGRGSRKQLRSVSQRVSRLRDATAMIQILRKISGRYPSALSEHTMARVTRQLKTHKEDMERTTDQDGSWSKIVRTLRDLEAAVKRWKPAHDGFRVLGPALRGAQRRGRKILASAVESQDDAHFHEWRKQIKQLWYTLRLIEDENQTIHGDVEALDRAQTLLGADHDAVVLCEYLSGMSSSLWHDPRDFEALRHAAARFQHEARRKAIRTSRRVYTVTARAYVLRIRQSRKKMKMTRAA
jgi:CHAD domain-containing protein